MGQYVVTRGHGNLGVLQDLADLRSRHRSRPARIEFGVLDVPGPGTGLSPDRWDVQGVLVGRQRTGPQPWYFFVVGVIRRQPRLEAGVEDIRLVGLSAEKDALHWCESPPQPEPLKTYVKRHATTRGPGAVFPGPLDAYVVEEMDVGVRVTEKQSGATWTLDLPRESNVKPAAEMSPADQATMSSEDP